MDTTDITISPALGFLAILNLLGAAQGLLLSLALLGADSPNKTANRLLAGLTLTISIVVSGAVLLSATYRVEEAKKKLLDPAFKHLSVLGIAEEVGFSSKSSFNSVFKKHTGTTPSEFRNVSDKL